MEKDIELDKKRHSLAHLMAAAVLDIYPDAKPTLGPPVENGFYYDFDIQDPISDKDLGKIEKKMIEMLPKWSSFEKKEFGYEEAKKFFKDNPYKLELIEEIQEKGETVTLYTSGSGANEFTDLCRGGHIDNMEKIKPESFSLEKIAGAYWRGDENNKMLTRIYGLAFNNEKELKEYKKQKEEAIKRDHRKIGKEMDLFTFSDLVGAGLPLFTPKGTVIRNELNNKLISISKKYGMEIVSIPHIAKKELYETSGHAQKFGDELIKVISHYDEFVMKPVNCPHHTQIYASTPKSYKDLPIRYMESTMQYRDEKPGEIGGLTRVRSITVDDGHIFCTVDQIKQEAKNIAKIIEEFYTSLGLFGNHWVSLSLRDPKNPDAYIGEDKDWKQAEEMLQEISNELSLDAKKVEGEAAIYGPKLDYMFKDSLNREWQLATIQIDFAMPKRFKLEYTSKDGNKETPVMIHRAILGSYERFMAILIEHFAGKFPLWIAPTQIKILPISNNHVEYSKKILDELKENDIRVQLDDSNENLGKKIRNAKNERTPYLAIIGDKEVQDGVITLEGREEKVGQFSKEELLDYLKKEIN